MSITITKNRKQLLIRSPSNFVENTTINVNQEEVFKTGVSLGYSIGLGLILSLTTTEFINTGFALTYKGCKKIYDYFYSEE